MSNDVLRITGADPAGVDFMFFKDPHQTLVGDVRQIADCPYLPKGVEVAGFVFDVATGRVEPKTDIFTVR
jgi:hypothetical protein